jgi:hypothetical protein
MAARGPRRTIDDKVLKKKFAIGEREFGPTFYLSEKSCRSLEDVLEVCNQMCDILNRIPIEMDDAQWEAEFSKDKFYPYEVNRFAEITACHMWNEHFNFEEIDDIVRHLSGQRGGKHSRTLGNDYRVTTKSGKRKDALTSLAAPS